MGAATDREELMPIYEYACPRCGQIFEKLVRMGAGGAPSCPSCGADEAQRLVSLVARSGSDCGPSGVT
jgi:putative FmdB family regulatory protein